MSIFVIINEWTDIQNSSGVEIVGNSYFESENEAWVGLATLAEANGTRIYTDETNFQLEDHSPHITFEEFYITELNKSA